VVGRATPRAWVVAALALGSSAFTGRATAAQQPLDVSYQFTAGDPATHLGDVTLRIAGPLRDSTLIQLPAWYPGRYAIYNFAANVQEVHATCGGADVPAAKLDKQTWLVRCRGASPLAFGYRVWWDDLNGSQSQIDSLHVNLNPGNTFAYVIGHKQDPVRVTYAGPAGWSVVNGAVTTLRPGPVTLSFPNYDVLIDHPTEISARFTVDTFTLGPVRYRVVVHAEGGEGGMRPRLVGDIERIVRAEVALWGDPPIDRYTFLIHYIPGNRLGGDGMEHLTSTQIVFDFPLADSSSYLDALGAVSHEFFHTWNMKRLRARELGPWDYTRENYTTTLWFGEGFTNYYGVRSLYRAGVWDRDRYLARVGAAIAQLQGSPGRLLMSARQSSVNAWLFDAVPLRQRTNLRNTTISYYNKGELLAWLADLEVRARTGGAKTLDDVMRLLWERFWKGATTTYYLQGHGYADADVRQALDDATHADFSDFFRRYVAGVEELPYEATLAKVGLALVRADGRYRVVPDERAGAAERGLGEAWLEGK
jgi:predicted metalloprotease with PDZ domain